MEKTQQPKKEQKQYLTQVPRRWVYSGLMAFAFVAVLLFVAVPHYKPLQLASQDETNQAHQAIIKKFFQDSITCKNDSMDKSGRIKTFNKYFRTNQYANRAIIRGCNDADAMLAKDDKGQWQKTDVNIVLGSRQNPEWQKACLIDDITVADTKVRPENSSIDANNLKVCDSLAKESYIQALFR